MALQQIDDDLLLADFGVSVTADSITGIGILDTNSEVILQGQVVSIDHALTCRTEQFGQLQYGEQIIVDGAGFKVIHEPIRVADGVFCVVPLEQVEININGVFAADVFVSGVFV